MMVQMYYYSPMYLAVRVYLPQIDFRVSAGYGYDHFKTYSITFIMFPVLILNKVSNSIRLTYKADYINVQLHFILRTTSFKLFIVISFLGTIQIVLQNVFKNSYREAETLSNAKRQLS